MTLTEASLERAMSIADDTRKAFAYDKSTGCWYWHDRGEPTEFSVPFASFWLALCDAVQPYTEH